MVLIYNQAYELKKLHYFRKEHFNYYKQYELNNSDEITIVLNNFFDKSYAENFDADGIHFFNITADATLLDSDNYYSFYNCKVYTSGRSLFLELPKAVTGKIFVKVSFDVYFYTIEETEEE